MRRDALPCGTRRRAWPGTRPARPTRRRRSIRWRPRPPRPWRWTRRSTTPRTASRYSAGSASPGNTTPTSTCAGHWHCASCWAAAPPGGPGPASLPWPGPGGSSGCLRAAQSARAAAAAAAAAARVRGRRGLPRSPQRPARAALADAGYVAPQWPAPYGLSASPAAQIVIDEELGQAGIDPARPVIGGWAAAAIVSHGTRRPAGAVRPPDAARRDHLVPAVQRAGRRLRPRRRCGPGRCGWPGKGEWAEAGSSPGRRYGPRWPTRRTGRSAWRAPTLRRPSTGADVFPGGHAQPGHRDPPAARDHRPRGLQRGLPRRRVRARRLRGRGRAGTAGGSPGARWPPSGWPWAAAPPSATRWRRLIDAVAAAGLAGDPAVPGTGGGGRGRRPGRVADGPAIRPGAAGRRGRQPPGGGAQTRGRGAPAVGGGDRAGAVRPGRRGQRRPGRGRGARLPAQPVPEHRRRHQPDPAVRGGRAGPRPAQGARRAEPWTSPWARPSRRSPRPPLTCSAGTLAARRPASEASPPRHEPGWPGPGQDDSYDRALWKELGQAGLLGLAVPGWLGGDGLGVAETAVLLTEIGRRAAARFRRWPRWRWACCR